MITINLLPEEFRRREKTPVRIFAATLGAAVVVTALGGTLAYLRFGKLVSVEQTLARLDEDKASLEPQVKHHDALEAEIDEYEKWRNTIRDVRSSRIPWSTKLDQFIDLVSQAGDQGRYLVWFNDLAVTQSPDGRGSGGSFDAKGVSGSDDVATVAAFLSDLKRSEFMADFNGMSAPEGKVVEGADNLIPKAVWEFPLKMTIAPRDPKKPTGPGAPAAAKPADGAAKTDKPEAAK